MIKFSQLPNVLTYSRFVLALVFMYVIFLPGLKAKLLGFVIFVVGTLTDYLDGYLARKYNHITPMGQLMDPIADKVLIFSAFISFVGLHLVPAWIVVLMLGREILITGIRLKLANEGKVIPARQSGKHKTVIQFACIFTVLGYLILNESQQISPGILQSVYGLMYGLLYLAAFLTLYSGVRVTMMNWNSIR